VSAEVALAAVAVRAAEFEESEPGCDTIAESSTTAIDRSNRSIDFGKRIRKRNLMQMRPVIDDPRQRAFIVTARSGPEIRDRTCPTPSMTHGRV
jgi:hypothetical protein